MTTDDRSALIDGVKRLGTVTKVSASGIELNLPHALAAAGRRGVSRGTVGDFVFIDCDQAVILGRIVEVHIPDRNRPALERHIEHEPSVEPVGRVQLLATIRKTTQTVVRGVLVSPRVGDGVFEANGTALSSSIQAALFGGVDVQDGAHPIAVSLGRISGIDDAEIALPPEKLFGRHCGIFGATGGGKSWTLAKLVSEVARLGGKAIVFDPTGEFSGKLPGAVEYVFTRAEDGQTLVRFPSERMTELSLFALLRPTGQSQGPTMREAIRSLRLVRALRNDTAIVPEQTGQRQRFFKEVFGTVLVEEDFTVQKTGQSISEYNRATAHYSTAMASELCDFDVALLTDQIVNECIWPSDNRNPGVFGGKADTTLNYCNTLIVRMRGMLASSELRCLFGSEGEDICTLLDGFLNDSQQRVCLISFKNVSFNHNARELLLNTIGEYLLSLARADRFRTQPVICFLDEAHQFMGRSVGDEFNSVSLDAFGLIAKEGRKYGLTTVLATQRPRDVPQDVLSQLGTLFVHRLTNERDRETIERACGDLDRSAAAFIPSLSQGEAIILGPDLPAPLPIKISAPERSAQPSSRGPNYQDAWKNTD
ncbi:ATP-binding protein [Phaeovulum sp. NW3]|nr:ATP-binding protein [Phaeovulum sp. NW3]